ncbi:MAG: ATP-binding protein [Tepidisphaeraceae bacterium]
MTASGDKPQPASSSRPERIELKITSDPANLREVRKKVESFAQSVGISSESSDEIGLALNEALANVIRHGYDGATDRPIVVSVERGDGELHVFIRDWAKPFDPSAVKPKGKLSPGGVGMRCIQELMDDVKFERLSDGMLLKMTKKTAKHDER